MQFKWHSSLTLKAVIYREEIIFHVAANWKRTFICVTNTFLPFSETLLCHQNAIFMYATNPQQWRAQSTGKTGVAPIKSFLHYSWRWKPAIMLPPVLTLFMLLWKLSADISGSLCAIVGALLNRQATFNTTKTATVARFACSAENTHRCPQE